MGTIAFIISKLYFRNNKYYIDQNENQITSGP